MDGVSVDFAFLGRFVLEYEEREYYHGPGLTKCEQRFGEMGKRSAGAFIMLTSSSELLP